MLKSKKKCIKLEKLQKKIIIKNQWYYIKESKYLDAKSMYKIIKRWASRTGKNLKRDAGKEILNT